MNNDQLIAIKLQEQQKSRQILRDVHLENEQMEKNIKETEKVMENIITVQKEIEVQKFKVDRYLDYKNYSLNDEEYIEMKKEQEKQKQLEKEFREQSKLDQILQIQEKSSFMLNTDKRGQLKQFRAELKINNNDESKLAPVQYDFMRPTRSSQNRIQKERPLSQGGIVNFEGNSIRRNTNAVINHPQQIQSATSQNFYQKNNNNQNLQGQQTQIQVNNRPPMPPGMKKSTSQNKFNKEQSIVEKNIKSIGILSKKYSVQSKRSTSQNNNVNYLENKNMNTSSGAGPTKQNKKRSKSRSKSKSKIGSNPTNNNNNTNNNKSTKTRINSADMKKKDQNRTNSLNKLRQQLKDINDTENQIPETQQQYIQQFQQIQRPQTMHHNSNGNININANKPPTGKLQTQKNPNSTTNNITKNNFIQSPKMQNQQQNYKLINYNSTENYDNNEYNQNISQEKNNNNVNIQEYIRGRSNQRRTSLNTIARAPSGSIHNNNQRKSKEGNIQYKNDVLTQQIDKMRKYLPQYQGKDPVKQMQIENKKIQYERRKSQEIPKQQQNQKALDLLKLQQNNYSNGNQNIILQDEKQNMLPSIQNI